jgi:hypothetical protein
MIKIMEMMVFIDIFDLREAILDILKVKISATGPLYIHPVKVRKIETAFSKIQTR